MKLLISEVIDRALFDDCRIVNEHPVDVLALCGVSTGKRKCTFIENEKYIDALTDEDIMVIASEDTAKKLRGKNCGLVITPQPRLFYFQLHNFLAENRIGIYNVREFDTVVSPDASVSEKAYIAPENVVIEAGVVIEPFVTVYPNVTIHQGSVIRSGARIGGVGFEYKHRNEGLLPVIHAGSVEIGENVEIQNNTCVDRAVYPWDKTVIGNNSKIDNLVHIAHGVKVANAVMIVALSGLGGRVTVDDNAWIGFGATIRNGISVGKNSRANMGSVVTKSVADNGAVTGNFAIDHEKFIENLKKMR